MEISDRVDNEKDFAKIDSHNYPLKSITRALFEPGYMFRWSLNWPKEYPQKLNLILLAAELEVGRAVLYAGLAYIAYETFK